VGEPISIPHRFPGADVVGTAGAAVEACGSGNDRRAGLIGLGLMPKLDVLIHPFRQRNGLQGRPVTDANEPSMASTAMFVFSWW